MEVTQIQEILGAEVLCGEDKLHRTVEGAFGSDLMSDVLAFAQEKVLLLTGLCNPQVIRTAEMMDIKVIVFVRGKVPGDDVIELAKSKSMLIMRTNVLMYSACGLLYSKGLGGGVAADEAAL